MYGTLSFMGPFAKALGAIAAVLVAVQAVQLSKPYVTPPTGQLAIVLGNTQNSPAPRLGTGITALLQETMLLHQGEDAQDVAAAFAFVSATANPEVVPVMTADDSFVNLSINDARAERDVRKNLQVIQRRLSELAPTNNGANYLEAVLVASQNVDPETNILVLGSGLSDSGDLDFAHDNLLTSEPARSKAIDRLADKYGAGYLGGATVSFAGLGDTAYPQVSLTSKQKDIVRDVYKRAVLALGGRVDIDKKSLVGDAINTDYTVDATDTGCGPLARTFTEDSVKFVGDQATYVDPEAAAHALKAVVQIYEHQPDLITRIKIDGFVANPSQAPRPSPGYQTLSLDRAQAVLSSLVELGIPAGKLHAEGKGFGPHNDPNRLELDRMVRVTIDRDNPDC